MNPQPPRKYDVFLSYSRRDEARVRDVEAALTGLGVQVWRDKREIVAGETFIGEIEAGLNESRCVVVFNSQMAIASNWVQREWNVALTLNMRIIPVLLDDAPVPLMLRPVSYIEFRDHGQLAEIVRQIAAGVQGDSAEPPPAPAAPSSNPSVLGQDVVVIQRMIESQQSAAQKLKVACAVAAALGVLVAVAVVVFGRGAQPQWIALAALGTLAMTAAIVWVILAQWNLSRTEEKRLIGIKAGIELYCPNQPACVDFRTRLESVLKKLAGVGEVA